MLCMTIHARHVFYSYAMELTKSELQELTEWLQAKAMQLIQSEDHEFDEEDVQKLEAVVQILENQKPLE